MRGSATPAPTWNRALQHPLCVADMAFLILFLMLEQVLHSEWVTDRFRSSRWLNIDGRQSFLGWARALRPSM